MHLTCNQSDLKAALSTVNRAIQGKTTMPILANVLIETDGQKLKLSGTNLEIGIVKWLDATITEAGSLTIPAKLLNEAVGNLPPGTIDIDADDKAITLKAGKTKTRLTGLPADDFPVIQVDGEVTATIEASALRKAITQAVIAASTNDTRPVLEALYVKLADEATFVTADGFRLAAKTAKLIGGPTEPVEILIPAKHAAELGRIVGDGVVGIVVKANGNQVVFRAEGVAMVSTLISGTFLNWQQLVPQSFTTKASVNLQAFNQAIKACSIFYAKGGNQLRLRIVKADDETRLRVTARGDETGENESEVDVSLDGEAGRIGFDGEMLRDGLAVMDTEQVVLCFNSPQQPAVLRPVGDETFTFVQMPMFLQWEEE